MVSLTEIIRNTKVRIVAIAGTVISAIPVVFAFISTRDGIRTGENISIVWAMAWPYVIILAAGVAAVANLAAVRDGVRSGTGAFVGCWRAGRSQVRGGAKTAFLGFSILAAVLIASLGAIFIWNCFGIAETQGRYVLRLASQDFRNRQMVLGRQYMEGYQLHDAARVYAFVRDRYEDSTARERLDEAERRYRKYELLSALSARDERRLGATPENAYREVATYLLSPFEADSDVRLQRYRKKAEQALQARIRLKRRCEDRRGATNASIRRDLAFVVEPEFLRTAGMDSLGWYCSTVGPDVVGADVLATRWRLADLDRLQTLRQAAQSASIVCPEPIPSPAETAEIDASRSGRTHRATKDTSPEEPEISTYARSLYSCPAAGGSRAKRPPLLVRLFRFLAPASRRGTEQASADRPHLALVSSD